MERSSVTSSSSEAGCTHSQEIKELERFIDSYCLKYQVQGSPGNQTGADGPGNKVLSSNSPDHHTVPQESEISQIKKQFGRKRHGLSRNQQRTLGENKSKQQQQEQQPQCYQLQTEQQKNATRYCEDNPGNHHDKHDSTLLERESQNRQWNHSHGYLQSDKGLYETTGETETVKEERFPSENIAENHQKGVADLCCKPLILKSERKAINSIMDGAGDTVRCILLASSKDKVQQQPIEKENTAGEPTTSEMKNMEKMIEILNNMKNKSSNQDSKLITFMKEAQNLVKSEEMLSEVVQAIYRTAVTDRSFASTAARLCGKMAHFVVEGTKFRSLLLNMLQKDFSRRHELQHSNVEQWLGFITFLCEVFVTMRIKNGEPYHALVSPIYTCLRELLDAEYMREDAVLCCSLELQTTGRLLEEHLPEMMVELLQRVQEKMLCPAESDMTRSLLLEVIELHSNSWNPMMPSVAQNYNKTIKKQRT